MRKILLSLLIVNFLLVGFNLAKAQVENQQDIGILPTNPFYFLKNWLGRLTIALTPDPLKRTEKEITFAEEKIKEAQIIAQSAPQKINAIKRALENYKAAQERLVNRLEKLPAVSQNPNVEKIIDTVVKKSLEHENLFKELENKFAAPSKISAQTFDEIKSKKDEVLAQIFGKDDPMIITEKLENIETEIVAIELTSAGLPLVEMPPIKPRVAEILKRLEDRTQDVKLKEKISNEFRKKIEDIKSETEQSPDKSKAILEEINKLDVDKQTIILNELQKRIEQKEIKSLVEAAQSKVVEFVKEIPKDMAQEKAKSLIDSVKNLIGQINDKLNALTQAGQKIPTDYTALFENAQKHFENGLAAYDKQDFGQSFGQLNSAYSILTSLIDKLNIVYPQKEDLSKILTDLESEFRHWQDKISGLANEDSNKTDANKILNEISRLLSQAKSEIDSNNIDAGRFILTQIKELFTKIRTLFAAIAKPLSPR